MAIQDYARILRERWLILVLTTVLVTLGAGVAWFLRPVEYTARITLYVSAQSADTANAAYREVCCPSSESRPTWSWSAACG